MGFWDWLMGTPTQQRDLPAKRKALPASKRTSVFSLAVGDVVSYEDVDYVVKNKITYDDEGFNWYDYLLADSATDTELWLSAEDDDGIQIGIYREIDLEVTVPPVPKTLTHEGRRYKQVEHSEADVEVEREDPTRSTVSRVEFWDFEGPDGSYIGISRWGGEYEASEGKSIKEYEIKIFPAME